MIKAIETSYKGYRFRSRLEARWAVFFDALGVGWTYEPEGFILPSGRRYLPDFFVETWKFYLEIKPVLSNHDLALAISKLMGLEKSTGIKCVLLAGNPWPGEHFVCFADDYREACREGSAVIVPYNQFTECRRCEGICLLSDDDCFADIGPHTCDSDKTPVSAFEHKRIMTAYQAARSARFEYGETPNSTRKDHW